MQENTDSIHIRGGLRLAHLGTSQTTNGRLSCLNCSKSSVS